MPSKKHDAERRRALLERWLSSLERIEPIYVHDRIDLPELEHDLPPIIRGYLLPAVSGDMLALLRDGLRRAVRGDADPFRLKLAGRPPALSEAEMQEAAATALLRIEAGGAKTNVIADVAATVGVDERTLRSAVDDLAANPLWPLMKKMLRRTAEG